MFTYSIRDFKAENKTFLRRVRHGHLGDIIWKAGEWCLLPSFK